MGLNANKYYGTVQNMKFTFKSSNLNAHENFFLTETKKSNRINDFTVISFLQSYFLIVLTFFNAELKQS